MTKESIATWTYAPLIAGVLGLITAVYFYARVKKLPEGNETMNRIARYIREGSMAFLSSEYKVLGVYAVVVFGLLTWGFDVIAGGSFALGAFLSLLAGFIGMKAATFANVRTAQAAREGSKANALLTALDGGAVMGLCVAGLSLLGLGGLYIVFRDWPTSPPSCTPSRSGRVLLRFLRVSAAVFIRKPPT